METIAFLPDILVLLLATVFVVTFSRRLKLSPVLGYLAAGVVIGPSGFAVIDSHDTHSFAEFGVVFLLFAIGLELTFERLIAMRRHVFGFGSAQVVLSAVLTGLVLYHFIGIEIKAALLIGGGLALSSTAIVLQVIAESGQAQSQVGRLSLAVLILQDFAVVPLLVLVPLLARKSPDITSAIGLAFLKAAVAMIGIFIVGRLLLRPLFRIIAVIKSEELFMAATLLIVLGAAWVTEHFGLSLALGAFIAGLLVAETEHHHRVEEDIIPFKALLMGLFFMTVGMSIDLKIIVAQASIIGMGVVALIVGKAIVITILCRLFRFPMGASLQAGLLLAQGGEFAFILFGLANQQGILSDKLAQTLMLIVTITMALTPLLATLGNWIHKRMSARKEADENLAAQEVTDLENHVVIVGFGRVGKMVAKLLTAERINYIALDINADIVKDGREEGYPVYKGDSARLETLQSIGIERARSIILGISNEVTLRKTLKLVNEHYPKLQVVVRSKDLRDAKHLKSLGATLIVPETYETGLQLAGAVLKTVGISDVEISRLKNRFRAGEYARTYDEQPLEPENGELFDEAEKVA